MTCPLRILGIHGLGDHRRISWADDWRRAIRAGLSVELQDDLHFVPFCYDSIYEQVRISPADAWRAVRKLLRSRLRRGGRVERLQESTRWLRWYAGYVVAWVENAEFRREVSDALRGAITLHQPDCLVAHSLGSLISYDLLSGPAETDDEAEQRRRLVYVTLGSQLGNPFVSGNLSPGRVGPLDVARWYHLFNEFDDVFTEPLRFPDCDRFEQVETPFNSEGWADHAAVDYLSHRAARDRVWMRLTAVLDAAGRRAKGVNSHEFSYKGGLNSHEFSYEGCRRIERRVSGEEAGAFGLGREPAGLLLAEQPVAVGRDDPVTEVAERQGDQPQQSAEERPDRAETPENAHDSGRAAIGAAVDPDDQ